MKLHNRHARRLLLSFIKRNPDLAIRALTQWPSRSTHSFLNMPDGPQHNFEDLDWMLVSNTTNRGLLRLDFEEAAFLFRLARNRESAQILEIGRFYGGSAFMFAVASDKNAHITSIDIAPQNDELLHAALKKHDLANKVDLLVADANQETVALSAYDLLFIDGDHSYEGVLKDYEHWKTSVKPGGFVVFHDAGASRELTTILPGPAQLMQEIVARDSDFFTRQKDVGSIAYFLRTKTPWPQ